MSNDNATCICGELWDRYGLMNGELPAWQVDHILAGRGCPSCAENAPEFIKPEPYKVGGCKECGRPFEIDQDEIFYSDKQIRLPDTHDFVESHGLCIQCVKVLTVECYVCDKRILEANAIESGDRHYCTACHEKHVKKCTDCGSDVGPGQHSLADDESIYCSECMKHRSQCRICKQIYASDCVHDGTCEKCLDELL